MSCCGAENLGGVQSAIDPDHGLPFARQRVRLFVCETLSERKFARDFLVVGQLLLIFGRRDDGHVLWPAFFRLADFDQLHAIRLGGELLPPGAELRVIGEIVIVADVESQGLFRSGDFVAGLCGRRESDRENAHE